MVQERVALRLAVLAALGLVLEVLVGVEELLARGPHERLVALHAHQVLVSVLHGLSSLQRAVERGAGPSPRLALNWGALGAPQTPVVKGSGFIRLGGLTPHP